MAELLMAESVVEALSALLAWVEEQESILWTTVKRLSMEVDCGGLDKRAPIFVGARAEWFGYVRTREEVQRRLDDARRTQRTLTDAAKEQDPFIGE